MDGLLEPSGGVVADQEDAYEHLAVSVVLTDANGQVASANTLARAIFAPLQPILFAFRSLLSLSGATGSGDLLTAIEARTASPSIRIGFPDGRIFDCCCRPLPSKSGCIITLVDVTAYIQNAELVVRDSLTGLATRANFRECLQQALERCRQTGELVAVLSLDLDKFKIVNDTLGHPVGDALLLKVAERLRSVSRSGDIVARLGGDEFAIIQTSEHQPQAAETLATRLVDVIGRTYIAAGHMITVGASVGIAVAPQDGQDVATLVRHADLALYRAKTDGRGTFRFFQHGMDAEVQSRRLLEVDLRRALALKELELFYQPQVDLESDRLVGFEALIRWRSPSRGLVSPGLFIPLAEEIGLIGRIGDWVLQTACRQAASWPLPVAVAVNISPAQFRGGKLIPSIVSALTASGLDPSRLEIEITEGSLLDNTSGVLEILKGIKSLGVCISMDDFGTGYSSLSYLQKFPFDKIKIDQSFVRTSDHSEESVAIVRAVAALGRGLGMRTIAEGVETAEQLARVRAEGCGAVQGYLTGRPLAAADATALMDGMISPHNLGNQA